VGQKDGQLGKIGTSLALDFSQLAQDVGEEQDARMKLVASKNLSFIWTFFSVLSPLFISFPLNAGQSEQNYQTRETLLEDSPFQSHFHVESFTTHGRLSFRLESDVSTTWKEVPGGFEIFLKGIGLGDLGAPLGEEEKWISEQKKQVSAFGDARLSSIDIQEENAGVKITGKWKFPTGKRTPAHPIMEHFDYREKSPPRLVIDFWPKPGPTLLEVLAAKKKKDQEEALAKAEKDAEIRIAARKAYETAKDDAANVEKFCTLPLDEKKDVFLPFLPYHEIPSFSKWFPTITADSQYVYLVPKGPEKDAQYVRVALTLYGEGKNALAIRTLDFMNEEFPKSPFRQEMTFLRANALIKLGHNEAGNKILNEIISSSRLTAVALHSGMYMANLLYSKKEYLSSLERFLWLVSHFGDHNLAWAFHLGAAEALYGLAQTDRAQKEYEWLITHAPTEEEQSEAALRFGDLFLLRQQYETALAGYFNGIEHYKKEADDFPSVYLNRAETLYWLGRYDQAKEAYFAFLGKFGSHPEGWRAAFRLGEIFGRRAGKASFEESRHWFYETINHYPSSPGAVLARERLLPCAEHGGLEITGAQGFFDVEATSFNGGDSVIMKKYQDYRALARVRTLITLGKQEEAVATAIQELQNHLSSDSRPILESLLKSVFQRQIMTLLSRGEKYQALAFYHDNISLLPSVLKPKKNSKIEYPEYLLKLSEAASDLGLGTLAENLVEDYGIASIRDGKSQVTEGSNRSPASQAEVKPVMDAELESSEQAFAEAKALWITSKTGSTEKVRELLGKVGEESKFSYEREVILGLLEQKEGKKATALIHASKAELLLPRECPERESKAIQYWITQLQKESGNKTACVDGLRRLEKRIGKDSGSSSKGIAEDLGVSPAPSADALYLEEAELLAEQGKWGEAAISYSKALENNSANHQALYEYARALRHSEKKEDKAKAYQALIQIAESSGAKEKDFWGKLACETLVSEKVEQTVCDAKEGGK